jgi:hypothetical protein
VKDQAFYRGSRGVEPSEEHGEQLHLQAALRILELRPPDDGRVTGAGFIVTCNEHTTEKICYSMRNKEFSSGHCLSWNLS